MRMIIMITTMLTAGTIITTITIMGTIMGMPTTTIITITRLQPMIALPAAPDCSIVAPILRVSRSPA